MINIEEQFKNKTALLKLLHKQRNDTIDLLKAIVDAIAKEEEELANLSTSLCTVDNLNDLLEIVCQEPPQSL